MSDQREPLHPLFQLAALSAGIFVFTILAMVATVFSDSDSPLTGFLNAHSGKLIGVEATATVLLSVLAMTADRRRTLRQMHENEAASATNHESVTQPKDAG